MCAPSLQKRNTEWMHGVGEGLRRLEESGRVVRDDLAGNDVFIDAVMQATESARRTANDTKRTALKNAVLHAAMPSAPDEALQQRLLRFLDRFGEWHLNLLSLADDPPQWLSPRAPHAKEWSMASLHMLIEIAYPDIAERKDVLDQVWKDLHSGGLVSLDSLHAMMTKPGMLVSRTTALGKELLAFVAPVA